MTYSFDDPYVASESLLLLLKDTKECLNIFEILECNRTWSEWASDWSVGERNSINMVRMTKVLKKLESNLITGLKACDKLFLEVENEKSLQFRFELMNQTVVNKVNAITFVEPGEMYEKGTKPTMKEIKCGKKVNFGGGVSATGTALGTALGTGAAVSKGLIVLPAIATMSTGAIGLTLAATAVGFGGITLVGGLLGAVAYHHVHSKGKDRGKQYQKVKQLYEVLVDLEYQGAFACFEGLKIQIESVTKQIKSRVENSNKILDKFEASQAQALQAQALQAQARLQIETDLPFKERYLIQSECQQRHKDGVKEAMDLYQRTVRKELEELATEEPDMDEEMRKRTAKRTAKNSCKSFLKGKLDYSNVEADDFLTRFLSNP